MVSQWVATITSCNKPHGRKISSFSQQCTHWKVNQWAFGVTNGPTVYVCIIEQHVQGVSWCTAGDTVHASTPPCGVSALEGWQHKGGRWFSLWVGHYKFPGTCWVWVLSVAAFSSPAAPASVCAQFLWGWCSHLRVFCSWNAWPLHELRGKDKERQAHENWTLLLVWKCTSPLRSHRQGQNPGCLGHVYKSSVTRLSVCSAMTHGKWKGEGKKKPSSSFWPLGLSRFRVPLSFSCQQCVQELPAAPSLWEAWLGWLQGTHSVVRISHPRTETHGLVLLPWISFTMGGIELFTNSGHSCKLKVKGSHSNFCLLLTAQPEASYS